MTSFDNFAACMMLQLSFSSCLNREVLSSLPFSLDIFTLYLVFLYFKHVAALTLCILKHERGSLLPGCRLPLATFNLFIEDKWLLDRLWPTRRFIDIVFEAFELWWCLLFLYLLRFLRLYLLNVQKGAIWSGVWSLCVGYGDVLSMFKMVFDTFSRCKSCISTV